MTTMVMGSLGRSVGPFVGRDRGEPCLLQNAFDRRVRTTSLAARVQAIGMAHEGARLVAIDQEAPLLAEVVVIMLMERAGELVLVAKVHVTGKKRIDIKERVCWPG